MIEASGNESLYGLGCFAAIVVPILGLAAWGGIKESNKLEKMTDEERREYENEKKIKEKVRELGPKNAQMVCPHCQTKGAVRTKQIIQKKGISGGKATAAVLTGGTSLLATGLAKKENATKATCENCGCSWVF